MKAEELYQMSVEERREKINKFTPEELEAHAAALVELLKSDIEDFGNVLSPVSLHVLKEHLDAGMKHLANFRLHHKKAQ